MCILLSLRGGGGLHSLFNQDFCMNCLQFQIISTNLKLKHFKSLSFEIESSEAYLSKTILHKVGILDSYYKYTTNILILKKTFPFP